MGKVFLMGLLANLGMLLVLRLPLNNRGEAGEGEPSEPQQSGKIEFTAEQQKAMDAIVKTRLQREREKYADYDQVKQKLSQFETQMSEQQQRDLEESRKYEEAKKAYELKLQETQSVLSQKDQMIQDMNIKHTLTAEVTKQNAYLDETLALLREKAALDTDGSVKLNMRDSNGLETQLSVEEGVKRFLESRPYLVKASHRQGSGATPGTPPIGGQQTAGDLNSLNAEMVEASRKGDLKRVGELKTKIREGLALKGVPNY